MNPELKIKELKTRKDFKQVIDSWKKLSASDQSSLEELCESQHDCYAICQDDTPSDWYLAIFDIRRVHNHYIKSMKIYLEPEFWDVEQTPKDLKEMNKLVDIFTRMTANIFAFLIKEATDTQDGKLKIYNEHPMTRTFFMKFAESLEDESPDVYKTKLYGNWLHIDITQNKE